MTIGRLAIWIVNAALFTLCCYLAAGLVNAGLADWLAGPSRAAVAPPAAAEVAARSWSDRQAILERNLFEVSTLLPVPPVEEVAEDEQLEATRLPLRLLGTVASPDPAVARAAVEDQQSRKTLVVRIDDRLLDKATVLRIERRRIVLQNGAQREELALDEDEGGAAVPPPRTARAPRRPPAASVANNLRDRIQRLSDSSFQVSRDDVDEAVRNPAELFSEARILPKYENGQMVGVQLSSIKAGSLFQDIGIQDGDTVTQVNGITISSPQDSAALLRELTEATDFQVNVVGADGEVRSLNYSIRE